MRVVRVKSLLYTRCVSTSTSTSTKVRISKYDVNIEEMIADGGFGFHAKVKSVS